VLKMTRALVVVICAILASLIGFARGQGEAGTKRPVSLSLKAIRTEVKAGTRPAFQLSVKNVSGNTQKVLDIRKRHDLQDTYFDLDVLKDGKEVLMPRAISDPGDIEDQDWVSLPTGASVTFTLSSFAGAWERLPPGSDKARVRFWQNPSASHTTSFYSPEAEFGVRP
jgi:hypothetical protein